MKIVIYLYYFTNVKIIFLKKIFNLNRVYQSQSKLKKNIINIKKNIYRKMKQEYVFQNVIYFASGITDT